MNILDSVLLNTMDGMSCGAMKIVCVCVCVCVYNMECT